MKQTMTTEARRRRRFSESFRQEQVKLIEGGQATIAEVSRRYEVRANSVHKWIRKYGTKKREEGLTVVGSSEDFDRLVQLEKAHKSLKVLFGEQQIELVRMKKLVELASVELGEDFEKKVKSPC